MTIIQDERETSPVREAMLFLRYVMRGSLVKRYHNITTLREDTDGRHSFCVAWLCYLLADRNPSVNLLMAALDHDLPEAVNSDPSSAAKWLVPELRPLFDKADEKVRRVFDVGTFALTASEELILAFADKLEAIMFTRHERMALGNHNISMVNQRYQEWVTKMIAQNPGPIAERAQVLLTAINGMYITNDLEEDVVHEHE